jgi:ABC-type branched-subunit amino acid transport system ATPase component
VRAPAASPGRADLRAEGISVRFGGVQAVRDVALHIPAGQITGIVGPNGAGKSTLFSVLAGTQAPDQGRVSLGGRDITRLAVHQRSRIGLGRTFQLSRELASLTVLENLLLAWPRHPGDALWRVFLQGRQVRQADAAALDRANALLRRVRLQGLANESAGVLSGGQKKLLELCRVLMMEPALILLDEPAAGVNPALVDELAVFIQSLRAEGRTFAIVEHNMDLIARLCDSVYVMAEGSILTHGSFAEVTADARVRQAYLGTLA